MTQEWWQDEFFWRDIGPYLFTAETLRKGTEAAEDILETIDLEEGATILDIGCGPGRLTIPLTRLGYRVVGIDICEQYRRECRRRAEAAGIEVDVRPGTVPDLGLKSGEKFDLVLDVFAVIGYPADPLDDILAVKSFMRVLEPGGQLLVRTRMPSSSHGTYRRRSRSGHCIEERAYERATSELSTRWTVVSGGRPRVHRSRLRVYEKDDLVGLLEFCGFADIRAFESPADEHITLVGTLPDGVPEGP